MTSQLTTIAPPAEEPTVDTTPADCPLTAGQCTVEKCVNLNDPEAQARCNLC